MSQQRPMPRLQAKRVMGKFVRTIMVFDENVEEVTGANGVTRKIVTRKMRPVEEEYNEAIDVFFPQGHSLRFRADDTKSLERYGILMAQPIIDMETGDVIAAPSLDLESVVKSKTRSRQLGA